MSVKFVNNVMEVNLLFEEVEEQFLEDASRLLLNQTIRNTRVDTGETKQNWDRVIDYRNHKAIVGNTSENAIWEEFGTGHYAVNGDGRKTPWYVPVDTYTGYKKPTFQGKVVVVYGKNNKAYYKTDGKKGNRALAEAQTHVSPLIEKRLQQLIKGYLDS